MTSKIMRIEALRGLVSLYIVLHHTLPHHYVLGGINVANINRLGQEAVMLFFLLSGFVIRLSFEHSSSSRFADYFSKRFYRIYVPLAVALAIGYGVRSLEAGALINPQLGLLIQNLLMLQDYADVKPNVWVRTYMDNDPLWSLSYEWWFYMLFFPLTTFVVRERLRDNIVFGLGFLAAIAYIWLPIFPVRVFLYLSIWWSGVYMAQLYMQNRLDSVTRLAKPLLALTLIASALAFNVLDKLPHLGTRSPGFYPWLELRHVVFSITAILFGFCWYRRGFRILDRLIQPFVLIAPISYSLYISHEYLFAAADILFGKAHPVALWLLALAATLAICYVIERMIYPAVVRRLVKRPQAVSAIAFTDRLASQSDDRGVCERPAL